MSRCRSRPAASAGWSAAISAFMRRKWPRLTRITTRCMSFGKRCRTATCVPWRSARRCSALPMWLILRPESLGGGKASGRGGSCFGPFWIRRTGIRCRSLPYSDSPIWIWPGSGLWRRRSGKRPEPIPINWRWWGGIPNTNFCSARLPCWNTWENIIRGFLRGSESGQRRDSLCPRARYMWRATPICREARAWFASLS